MNSKVWKESVWRPLGYHKDFGFQSQWEGKPWADSETSMWHDLIVTSKGFLWPLLCNSSIGGQWTQQGDKLEPSVWIRHVRNDNNVDKERWSEVISIWICFEVKSIAFSVISVNVKRERDRKEWGWFSDLEPKQLHTWSYIYWVGKTVGQQLEESGGKQGQRPWTQFGLF